MSDATGEGRTTYALADGTVVAAGLWVACGEDAEVVAAVVLAELAGDDVVAAAVHGAFAGQGQ